MPGNFGRPVTKSFWGDVQLRSGASLHARIIGSYSGDLLDDLLAELSPIEPSDMIIVNFGAWYPAFAWQVCPWHADPVPLVLRVNPDVVLMDACRIMGAASESSTLL